MVTFKGEWDKLYYTQHIILSNVKQLPILFFEKQRQNLIRKTTTTYSNTLHRVLS